MQRRDFLATSLATSALALSREGAAQPAPAHGREFYLIRRYNMVNGPQTKLTESYFSDALIPALTRIGLGPTGAFSLAYGPETPAYVALIPEASAWASPQMQSAASSPCVEKQARSPARPRTARQPS